MDKITADKLLKVCSYELDDHSTEWAKGIHSEHNRLMPIITALISANLKLVEGLEFYASGSNLNFDPELKETLVWPRRGKDLNWQVAAPYLVSAEMGQQAANALTQESEIIKGVIGE